MKRPTPIEKAATALIREIVAGGVFDKDDALDVADIAIENAWKKHFEVKRPI